MKFIVNKNISLFIVIVFNHTGNKIANAFLVCLLVGLIRLRQVESHDK